MPNLKTEGLKKAVRALSQALKGNPNVKSAELIIESLEDIFKVLKSSSKCLNVTRRAEVSCILISSIECYLIESYILFVKNSAASVVVQDFYQLVYPFSDIILVILQEAPEGKARNKFINLLAESAYADITAEALLFFTPKRIPYIVDAIISQLVKICHHVCLHIESTKEALQHVCAARPSFLVAESSKNFLVCCCLHVKLLLLFLFPKVRSSASCMPGTYNFPPTSHACGESSQTTNSNKAEPDASGASRRAFTEQHLLLLHDHMLQAAKLLEPTFQSLAHWGELYRFLLSANLPLMPDNDEDDPAAESWEQLFSVMHLLFDMFPLNSAPHPLQEVIVNMALELLTALGASGYIPPFEFMETLGGHIWEWIQKDPYAAKSAHLTVRLFFAFQLGFEAMSCQIHEDFNAMCSSWGENFDEPFEVKAKRALGDGKYDLTCRALSAAHLLYEHWMSDLNELLTSSRATKERKHAALRALHERAIEALLERQIRWLFSRQTTWAPTRGCLLVQAVGLLSTLLSEPSCICVSCHLSLCATLTKVVPALVDDIFSAGSFGHSPEGYLAAEAILNVFLTWISIAIVNPNPNSSVPVGIASGSSPCSSAEPHASGQRYIPPGEMSSGERATLICYSLPALLELLSSLAGASSVPSTIQKLLSEMLMPLVGILQDVNNSACHSQVGWFLSTALKCSIVPYLRRVHFTAPLEACRGAPSIRCLADELSSVHLLLQSLPVSKSQIPETLMPLFASELIRHGILNSILSSLESMEPDFQVLSGDGIEFKGDTVDILEAAVGLDWAACWIAFLVLVLEVQAWFPDKPLFSSSHPLHQIDYYPFDLLVMKKEPERFIVLRERNPIDLGNTVKGSLRPMHWIATRIRSGEIEHDGNRISFLPSASFFRSVIGVLQEAVDNSGEGNLLQVERPIHFSAGIVSMIHMGCWSRQCRAITGRSEASLSTHVCACCRTARYCCRDCQRADWLRHRGECKPWEEAIGC